MIPKQQETNNNQKVDKFTEALAAARQMQQDWLNYGLDFVHLYVEDVNGNWLEKWEEEQSILDSLKLFLVSDDDVAVRIREQIGERSLFDIAVNLEELLSLPDVNDRLFAVKNLLADEKLNDTDLLNLADNLLEKLAEIV
jgi:hypothetical protein